MATKLGTVSEKGTTDCIRKGTDELIRVEVITDEYEGL